MKVKFRYVVFLLTLLPLFPLLLRAQEEMPPAPEENANEPYIEDEPTAKKNGREAYIIVTLGSTRATGRADDDIKLLDQLEAGYSKLGYNVHGFATSVSFSGVRANMATVSALYVKNGWVLNYVAFHYVGHGHEKGIRLIPLSSKNERIKGEDLSHVQAGQMIAGAFPATEKVFKKVLFSGMFEACNQGDAISTFPKGLRSGGQPKAGGVVMTSTGSSDDFCSLGVYGQGFAQGMLAGDPVWPLISLKEAHVSGEKALLDNKIEAQKPQIGNF